MCFKSYLCIYAYLYLKFKRVPKYFSATVSELVVNFRNDTGIGWLCSFDFEFLNLRNDMLSVERKSDVNVKL